MGLIKYTLIILLLSFINESQPKYPHVYVEWVDIIQTDSGWHSEEEIQEWLATEQDTVKQAGFLYLDNEKYIVLLDSHIKKTHLGSAIKIPKCNIVKMKRI